LTVLNRLTYIDTMNPEERNKIIKHALIDKGLSFRSWCAQMNIPYSVARDLVYGRLTGNKSERSKSVRDVIAKEFGENLFE
jgi:hypothetical protein